MLLLQYNDVLGGVAAQLAEGEAACTALIRETVRLQKTVALQLEG
ncbi:hypothetical protein MKZ15_05725 [Paenibacillus sp. FSL R7-0216]